MVSRWFSETKLYVSFALSAFSFSVSIPRKSQNLFGVAAIRAQSLSNPGKTSRKIICSPGRSRIDRPSGARPETPYTRPVTRPRFLKDVTPATYVVRGSRGDRKGEIYASCKPRDPGGAESGRTRGKIPVPGEKTRSYGCATFSRRGKLLFALKRRDGASLRNSSHSSQAIRAVFRVSRIEDLVENRRVISLRSRRAHRDYAE